MIFGHLPVHDAQGAILAHSIKHADGVFKKGRVLSPDDIRVLTKSGVTSVFAAKLSPDDIPEDEAAQPSRGSSVQLARWHRRRSPAAPICTPRRAVSLSSMPRRVRALNRLHESLTLATVAPFAIVERREMVATVKVIPFAVPRAVLDQGAGDHRRGRRCFGSNPSRPSAAA
jgi:molybdenum cofactor cytidylyltransferase